MSRVLIAGRHEGGTESPTAPHEGVDASLKNKRDMGHGIAPRRGTEVVVDGLGELFRTGEEDLIAKAVTDTKVATGT